MISHSVKWLRGIRALFIALIATLLISPTLAAAQDADIDWADAGVSSLTPFPSGTSVAGSDGTTATVTWSVQTQGGGSFVPAYGGDFVSYFSGTIGSGQSPLLMSFNNSSYDPGDKITIDITLNRAVSNLRFSLGDIDFGTFADAVEVYHDGDLAGGFTNSASNSAFWTTGSSVTRTNNSIVNGWRGTGASDQTATNGNVNFNFGNTGVQRIRIVYFSYSGTGDPTEQFSGISDLLFQAATADLSLIKTLTSAVPTNGGTATYRLTVANSSTSTLTADGIVVDDNLPASFTFTSSTGDGNFNASTGRWTVPDLAPGASAFIDITGTISASAGTVVTNTAEIFSSNQFDFDSTPNNGATGEDDYASATFTVQAGRPPGIPPTLVCPNGFLTFDWAGRSWPQGSTANNYTLSGLGSFNWSISSPAGFMNIASLGGQHPVLTTAAQNTLSLSKAIDFATETQFATTTITLGETIDGAQFTIFDVDFAANDFADRVKVYGTLNGVTVIPVLTNGSANYVVGNEAFGDLGSDPADDAGNVIVTFSDSIDTIIIEYGNHAAAPDNPDGQAIQMGGGITVCSPDGSLTVAKTSVPVEDPVNGTTDPKYIPGARIRYCILITNIGTANATNVTAVDALPGDITYVPGSMLSGTTCSNASTPEDDDDAGTDESDPVGAAIASGSISLNTAALNSSATVSLTFEALID